jgi:hypothetical protein
VLEWWPEEGDHDGQASTAISGGLYIITVEGKKLGLQPKHLVPVPTEDFSSGSAQRPERGIPTGGGSAIMGGDGVDGARRSARERDVTEMDLAAYGPHYICKENDTCFVAARKLGLCTSLAPRIAEHNRDRYAVCTYRP